MFERMLDKSINPQYSDLVGFCGTQEKCLIVLMIG